MWVSCIAYTRSIEQIRKPNAVYYYGHTRTSSIIVIKEDRCELKSQFQTLWNFGDIQNPDSNLPGPAEIYLTPSLIIIVN